MPATSKGISYGPLGAWYPTILPEDRYQHLYGEPLPSLKPPETGQKFDNEKPRMSLIDPEFLEGLAEVLTKGAKKYAAHNWRGGISVSRLLDASYRHLGAINRGEDLDSEWNLPHVYHLACEVMFLSWMIKHRPDLDDRWKSETTA